MEDRFRSNLDRVRNIVLLYESTAGVKQGRPSVQESDLLRAAVILLHATLEDLLRSIAEQSLPNARADVLKLLPWPRPTGSTKTTLDLGDLASFRGHTVEDVLHFAIKAYLAKTSFNHPGDLKQILDWIGLDPSVVDPFAAELGVMIARRHLIVHRADSNENAGRGQHQARSISKSLVLRWVNVVERFGNEVLLRANSA